MSVAAILRLVRRDLRGGLRGFSVFLACLALGVAAIAGALSLDAALRRAMTEDARALLGGDVELRLAYRGPSEAERAFLDRSGTLSDSIQMRAMARSADSARQTLVEVKAVDGRYPLYGSVDLTPPGPLSAALSRRADGLWGVAVDPNLLDRLGAAVGDEIRLGDVRVVVTAVIAREPDRVANAFAFGPRLLLTQDALTATGLMQPGSVVYHAVLVRLASPGDIGLFRQTLDGRFPDAGWQIRDARDAAPGVKRFLDQMTQFLTLVGLSALLVGGIGVAGGVQSFLDTRIRTIAILKCLGTPAGAILTVYGVEVALLAALGIGIGLAVGATLPFGAAAFAADQLPVAARPGLYPAALAEAAAFGGLSALLFSIWPLARAVRIPAAALFRDTVAPDRRRPGWRALATIAATGVALGALTVLAAPDRRLAVAFVLAAVATIILFLAAGRGVVALARASAHGAIGRGGHLAWRLGLSSLGRPGAPTQGIVLAAGLGLTLLVTVAEIEANLKRQLEDRVPAMAPAFFFIDIQPADAVRFDRIVTEAGGEVRRALMVRGRITKINGVSADQASVAPDAQWALRGDRGLSTAASPPDNARVVAGQWWPATYDGPPLVSLDAGIARGFGLSVGNSITVNVLGREITARVANLREIDWASLAMNFTFILSPNALAGAPATYIATVQAPDGAESGVERAVTEALPAVSSIRVKEALTAVRDILGKAMLAIEAAALVTLTAGALVLAGAVAAGRQRRLAETVLLKVLGAARRDLMRALLVEFAVLGAATGIVAAVLGSAAAWAVLVGILRADWVWLPGPVGAAVAGGLAAIITLGAAGTARVLGTRPSPYLRHD